MSDIDDLVSQIEVLEPTKRKEAVTKLIRRSVTAGELDLSSIISGGPGLVTGGNEGATGGSLSDTRVHFSFGEGIDHSTTSSGATQVMIESKSGPSSRLGRFSGKVPPPSSEVDFLTWRLHARQMLDSTRRVEDAKRVLLESLQRPALEVVAYLIQNGSAEDMFTELDNVYGRVLDAESVLARLHTVTMETNEMPSAFLQRIHLIVMEAVECSAISSHQTHAKMLRTFIYGCPDEALIQKLGLEGRMNNPPSFSELMKLIRKEETMRAEKRARHRKTGVAVHQVMSAPAQAPPGAAAQPIASAPATSDSADPNVIQTYELRLAQQQKTIADLQKRVDQQQPSGSKPKSKDGKMSSRFWCYNCGLDAHKMHECSNPANPTLVHSRMQDRKNWSSGRRGSRNRRTGGSGTDSRNLQGN